MDYDLLVLGGGAAGLAAAQAGVDAGASVLLVSEGELGGDCTFTGCVPSKTLIEAAAAGASFAEAMSRVRATVARIAATEDESVLRRRGINVMRGRARIVSRDTIDVDGRRVRGRRIVIATGATPVVPPLDGLAATPYLTTETVFDLTEPPESLAILGGGAVGCELAQAFARIGVAVSIVEAMDRLLPGVEPEASALLAEIFDAEGVAVHAAARAHTVQARDGQVVLHIDSGKVVSAQRLLVAVGRSPCTGGLGLDAVGVKTDERGFVVVDRHMRTTADQISAAGDVTGLFPHTHAAYGMGRVAVRAALRRRRPPSFDATAIPQVVFTAPEIASVGVVESDVADDRARVAFLPLSEVDRAITADRTTGFVKLLAGPRPLLRNLGGGRVLGATIMADRAGELVHEPALAMRTRMFTGRLAQTVHAYPTWSLAIQQATAQFFGAYGGRTARPAHPRDEI
ncbi:oxidoreductase [Longimycelium tulufanense]|uniref:Oxidoreductase n=1 Tax=Longimycelium tulufanense TaxID=907463 RepID=A0A8J3FWV7_9PSEU|nr:NAD(P)/FAD-dependent oxidoreductase [Longimycelium tulufanense]GGM80708.1 oxidoreductase [Longimycelium tulufanense]